MDRGLYRGREQTLVKHEILRKYLERFAHIIYSKWDSITYSDCFSGPWMNKSEELSDTSFSIAIEQLSTARDTVLRASPARKISARCFFIEKDADAYSRLDEFARQKLAEHSSFLRIETKHSEFVNEIPALLSYCNSDRRSFPFFFIDPTGYSDIKAPILAPLLQLQPCEVLINLMTSFIFRTPDAFFDEEFLSSIADLSGQDKDDAMVFKYMSDIRSVGGFKFACVAVVLNPLADRAHFHLVYATRHPKGVEVFKEAERKSVGIMEDARAQVKAERESKKRGGQISFLPALQQIGSSYSDDLRNRYSSQARAEVIRSLSLHRSLGFDALWEIVMRYPLTWEADLKAWLATLQGEGKIEIIGLKPRQRVPQVGQGQIVNWLL